MSAALTAWKTTFTQWCSHGAWLMCQRDAPDHVRDRAVRADAAPRRQTPEVAPECIEKAQPVTVDVGIRQQRFLLVEDVVAGRAAHEQDGRDDQCRRERDPEGRVLLVEVAPEPRAEGDQTSPDPLEKRTARQRGGGVPAGAGGLTASGGAAPGASGGGASSGDAGSFTPALSALRSATRRPRASRRRRCSTWSPSRSRSGHSRGTRSRG